MFNFMLCNMFDMFLHEDLLTSSKTSVDNLIVANANVQGNCPLKLILLLDDSRHFS